MPHLDSDSKLATPPPDGATALPRGGSWHLHDPLPICCPARVYWEYHPSHHGTDDQVGVERCFMMGHS